MTNVEKLQEHLRKKMNDPKKKLLTMHVSWAPGAENLTQEERAGQLLSILEAEENGNFSIVESIDSHLEQCDFRDLFKN